jgi:hypothetical protein
MPVSMSARPAAADRPALGNVPDEQYLRASDIAEAILYDGYLLRPGSRRGGHGRPRRVGVLAPRDWSEQNLPLDTGVDGAVESWFARTEVVAERAPGTSLTVRLRFLQPQRRNVDRYLEGTGFVPTSRLDIDGWLVSNAEEAIPHERDLTVDVDALRSMPAEVSLEVTGVTELEVVRDRAGVVRGRIRRTCRPLQIRLQIAAADAGLVVPMARLRVVVENVTEGVPADASAVLAAEHSMVATHCFLGLSDGGFASLLDPPSWSIDAVGECTNIHTFPVLAGDGGREDLVLSAPVLLPDHPHGQPRTYGDELDAAGTEPSIARPLPTPVTPATYPVGPVPAAASPVATARWVVVRPA